MSTSLAIGAVSAILRSILQSSIAAHGLTAILDATPTVSMLPPDRPNGNQQQSDQLRLFLLQATENPALRNSDLPSRNGAGDRLTNPALALDLHYLLTASGADQYHAEILLGHAMFVLHETPVIGRQRIRDILSALEADPGEPQDRARALAACGLADQLEQIRITPRTLSLEELSKIWTALQSPYRSTAAYRISVVLIRADKPGRSAPPVLSRGGILPSGSDQGAFVHAALQPPVPTLLSLEIPQKVAIRMGEQLSLVGHHLTGDKCRASFRAFRSDEVVELDALPSTSEDRFTVNLPPDPPSSPPAPGSALDPASWRAGVYQVSAIITRGTVEHRTRPLPLILVPRLNNITLQPSSGPLQSIQVACSPPVRTNQEAVLIVGDRELTARPFASPTGTLTFDNPPAEPLPSGTLPIRLRIDGIESLGADRTAIPPAFEHTATLP